MALKAGNWAKRLGFGPQGRDLGLLAIFKWGGDAGGGGEKFPICVNAWVINTYGVAAQKLFKFLGRGSLAKTP